MNVEQKVATLEALLARVKRNAAEARPPRALLHVVAPVDDSEVTQDLPPELAHAVLPASPRAPAVAAAPPVESPKPAPVVESPKPPIVESPKPAAVEPAPESKPRLVALSPPLATAGRGGPVRSPTPTYGVPAQRPAESPKPAAARPITPQTPPVIAKPITPSVGPKPSVSRPAPVPKTAAPAAKADSPAAAPVHERSGAKTLMGTGLDEMRKALAQLDTRAPPAASPPLQGAQIIADDSTGEGATMVRSSPLEQPLPMMAKHSLVEEASTEDEQTVLIPQPTQEELIAASERAGTGARRKVIEDETGDSDTLVKDSPFSAPLIEPEPPTVSKPTPAAQQPAAASPKVAPMGTMMMPVSASPPPAAAASSAPATTASRTVIMEPALAATVQSEKAPEPPPPKEMPAAMPGVMETPAPMEMPGVMPGPMGVPASAEADARPAPVQPSFLRDGPVYEAPLPSKKKSRAGAFGVGLAAAALVAAGVFLSLRNGWLDQFIGTSTTTASPSATAVAPASAAPSAKASAAPTAAEATSEVPATAAPPASAAAASASAAASAAPSSAPSAKPVAEAGDASALPKNKGILMVTATQPGVVYVNGKFAGTAGEPLTVDCGIRYIRLAAEGAAPGKTPTFVGHGRPLKIACRATTTAELPAAAGLDGPQAPAGDAPSPGGSPAPDL